jgi:hypothetical protein
MAPKFQISLEYMVLASLMILGGLAMYFVGSSTLPVSRLNKSSQSVMVLIREEGLNFTYNVTQDFDANLTIFGMVVWPYYSEQIFSVTAVNYSVTFLATGETVILGKLLPGSSPVTRNFQDEWFSLKHISYEDGRVSYLFNSSLIEDYLT